MMNEAVIHKFFKTIKGNNPLEVRAIKKGVRPISFFSSNEDNFVKKVVQLNKEGYNIYAGYNDRRAKERGDNSVISNKYFVIDIDFDKNKSFRNRN
jgi:hypothetical protein